MNMCLIHYVAVYPYSGEYGDANVTCTGQFCYTDMFEISPLYMDGIKLKYIQVS